jgi:nucleotide-binding universal stress UspA family protein
MTAHEGLFVKEILAPTDFSAPSIKAINAALALARHFRARLQVLHVVSDASERNTAEAKLESLTAEIEGVEIVKGVSIGHAAAEIVKYAQGNRIDAIVLSTHGRTGIARVLMGSVAEAVLRSAPCQVITIGPKAQALEEAVPPQLVCETLQSHCLVCAKLSQNTICDSCKARIQGEAIEQKRREEQPGHRGLTF